MSILAWLTYAQSSPSDREPSSDSAQLTDIRCTWNDGYTNQYNPSFNSFINQTNQQT